MSAQHTPDWSAEADAMVAAMMPRIETALKKASESIYEDVLYTAEEYLKDNVRYNVKSTIDAANRQAQHDRTRAHDLERQRDYLINAARRLLSVIDSAGLHNLTHGVHLGQVSWFVKATDAVDATRAAIAKATGEST